MTSMQRVRGLLAERGMSLMRLADLSNTSYSTFKMTERRGGQLSVDTIERVCRALGISMAQFFAAWEEGGKLL